MNKYQGTHLYGWTHKLRWKNNRRLGSSHCSHDSPRFLQSRSSQRLVCIRFRRFLSSGNCQESLKKNTTYYHFCSILKNAFYILCSSSQLPETSTFQDYITYMKSLPLNDHPNLFGLHANADISCAQSETYACLDTLLALQPREVGGASVSVDQVTNQLARDILKNIPEPFDLRNIQNQ